MVVEHDLFAQLVAKVVHEHNLTGIVVGVTVFLSLRIFLGSSEWTNARVRTGDTIVAMEIMKECGVKSEVDSGGGRSLLHRS